MCFWSLSHTLWVATTTVLSVLSSMCNKQLVNHCYYLNKAISHAEDCNQYLDNFSFGRGVTTKLITPLSDCRILYDWCNARRRSGGLAGFDNKIVTTIFFKNSILFLTTIEIYWKIARPRLQNLKKETVARESKHIFTDKPTLASTQPSVESYCQTFQYNSEFVTESISFVQRV